MNEVNDDKATYRFAAYGARGTIHLEKDCVRTRTRTYLGWWEQTIPLKHLSPNYGTLTTTPPFFWCWIFVILPACLFGTYGLGWGIATYVQKLISGSILLFGLGQAIYLLRRRETEWVMFPSKYSNQGVNYTRQGPDAANCDAFTKKLVEAIHARRSEDESRRIE